MMVIERGLEIYRRHGFRSLCRRAIGYSLLALPGAMRDAIYRHYQSHVRYRTAVAATELEYNGVTIRPHRTADRFFPFQLAPNQGGHRNPEEYEAALIKALRGTVDAGDDVTIVGGGLGVTVVIAAQETGVDGSVTVYEGAGSMLPHIEATLAANDVPATVDVVHGIVGDLVRLDGAAMGAPTVSPSVLGPTDVLELDCEGAEVEILKSLTISPRVIVVETHGNKAQVLDCLDLIGYKVVASDLAEREPYEQMCRNNEIEVLTAVRADDA